MAFLEKKKLKECPILYVCQRRKCNQGSDSIDWKVVSASVCSCKRPRGVLNTILVLPVGLMGGKREAEKIEMKVTYRRRLSEDKPVDFHTKISSRFSGKNKFSFLIPHNLFLIFLIAPSPFSILCSEDVVSLNIPFDFLRSLLKIPIRFLTERESIKTMVCHSFCFIKI